jgi:hypothetical protein
MRDEIRTEGLCVMRKRFTDDDKRRFVGQNERALLQQLCAEGKTTEEIAQITGRKRGNVSKILAKLGLSTMFKPGETVAKKPAAMAVRFLTWRKKTQEE